MPKITRRIKRNRKNRTYKNAAIFDNNKATFANIEDTFGIKGGDGPDEKRKGIIDIISEKIGDAASVVVDKGEDISLNALGLERIDKSKNENAENIDKISDAASGVVSNVGNTVNKTSTAVIDKFNNILGSQAVSENVQQAATQTAEITGKLAGKFNDAMNKPEVKEELQKAIENAGEVGEVIVKASEKPLKEAVRVGVEAGSDAFGAASAGAIKVGTDMLSAIPYFGAIIDLGKMINDGSKAASAVVEAGSEAVETASDAFLETSENVKQGLKELEEKKKMAQQISNRTTQSINQFENPLQATTQTAGSRKTKRRLLKHKAKSKRVRFAT
jgi:hypothetical protein